MSRRLISYSEMESYLARARRERAETIAKLLSDGLAHSARAIARAGRWRPVAGARRLRASPDGGAEVLRHASCGRSMTASSRASA